MIADELASALRNESRAGEVAKCPREEDFIAMYQALGDREKQDGIRESHPDAAHCMFLKASSEACNELPETAGDYAGRTCPNNPWERDAGLFENLTRQAQLLQYARYILDLTGFGFLPRPERIDPVNYEIARIMQHHEREENIQMRQAAAMGMGGE